MYYTQHFDLINEIDNITLNEGTGTTIEMSAFDIDGDELIFTAQSDETVGLTIDDNLLSILTPPDAGDSEIIINVTVEDGISSDLETFSVFTQNLNDPPTTLSLDYEVNEDSELSIIPEGSDPDGDAITFFVGSSTQNGTLTVEDGHFLYIPNQNFTGLDSFTYFANDGEYDSDISTISIFINNVNDPPILSEIDNQNIQEGQTIEVDLNANDIDGDLLSFSVLSVDGFTSNIIGNILTISPDNENFNGEVNFTVLVNDGELEDSESFKLFYLPVNDVPQISSISNAVILEDQSFITLIETFDFDNDSIDLSAEISGNASAFIDDHLFTVTPNLI